MLGPSHQISWNICVLSSLVLLCSCGDMDPPEQDNAPSDMSSIAHDMDMPESRDEVRDMPSSLDTCLQNEHVKGGTCSVCPLGTHNEAGDPANGGDTSCSAVSCKENEFVSSNSCTPCALGTTNEAGDDASGDDTICDAVLCAEDQNVSNHACVSCPAGTTNEAGDDASGDDTACDATLCEADNFVSNHLCTPCPLGSTNDAGDDAAGEDTSCDITLCAENQFVSNHVCRPCEPNTTNMPGDDASGEDTYCDGELCASNQHVSNGECTPCALGTTNEAGDDASGDDTICDAVLCAEDQNVSNHACVSCPAGTTNEAGDDASGDDTACDATLCEADNFVSNHLCTPCPLGSTNDAGDDAAGENTSCDITLCQLDEYVVAHACEPCPPGTTNDGGDSAIGIDTTCDAILCPANERVLANTCTSCPPGSTNDAGDDASGSNTSCDFVACQTNERVVSNQCIDCPLGTTNQPGDDASGTDTTCDAVLCPSNERVLSNMCTMCAPGETNDSGDDASGSDTLCDEILCGANEHVVSHTCTICPSGMTNMAGDSAAGLDTLCDDSCTLAFAVSCLDMYHDEIISPGEGDGVAISGNTLVVADWWKSNGSIRPGAVFVYTRIGSTWTLQTTLTASNMGDRDFFGSSVAIEGDTIVVGASGEDGPNDLLEKQGAAYVFERSGSVWSETAILRSPSPDAFDEFGDQVAISQGLIAVSAPSEDSGSIGVTGNPNDDSVSNSGAVYVYASNATGWEFQAYLKPSNTHASANFGSALTLDNDTLVVGSIGESSSTTGINSSPDLLAPGAGAAYVFKKTGMTWSQEAYIKASNAEGGDQFGHDIALAGDILAISSQSERSNSGGVNGDQSNNSLTGAGAVYVFERNGSSWSQQAYIKSDVPGLDDRFHQVAVEGNRVYVGEPNEDGGRLLVNGSPTYTAGGSNTGAIYVYEKSGNAWARFAYIKNNVSQNSYRLGADLAVSGGVVVALSEAQGHTRVFDTSP